MRSNLLILVLLVILLSTSVSHAAFNLNMNVVPFQGNNCPDLTPAELQTAYGFTSLYNQGINGSGENVAIIVTQGDPNLISDLNSFDSAYNLPALIKGNNLFVETPFGNPSANSSNWTAETALDVETVHSFAPGANIYLVIAPNDTFLFNVTQYAIENLPIGTISMSWGASEETYSQSAIIQQDDVLASAAQKGITVFAASGDSGAYNSLNSLNVNFPASSPYVVAVGGTALSIGPGGVYSSETAWSQSGGGQSQFFQKPSPQPNLSSSRMVPDVSFNAGTPICAYVNSTWGGYYGTSVAAPAWAALDALLNQKTLGNGAMSLRSLYQAYYSQGSLGFNLISSGNNGFYYANGGYSMVTGIGTPKAYQLLQILSSNYQKITFNSTIPNVVFSINGVNYTSPVTLNFSYGTHISLKSYATAPTKDEKYLFSSYSGLLNGTNQASVFSAVSNGHITAYFELQFRVLQMSINGYQNSTSFLTVGSILNINSSLRSTIGNKSYSLVGFKIDNGPIIYKNIGEFAVNSAINVTYVWLSGTVSKFSFVNAPANAGIEISYSDYVPLSNTTSIFTKAIQNGGNVSIASGTSLNYSSVPIYFGGYRYITRSPTTVSSQIVYPVFIRESQYNLQFFSSSGLQIYPTQIYTKSGTISDEFTNSTVWAPIGTDFYLEGVVFGDNGFNVLNEPVLLYSNSTKYNISLSVGNVAVSVGLYLGIPVISANVKFAYSNLSLSNFTGVNGVTTFYDVPDSNYNLTISAYGSNYNYNALNGTEQAFQVTPLLYQLYIIVSIVSIVILIVALGELRHRKKKLANGKM